MKKLVFAILCIALAVPSLSFAADLASDANYKAKCAMCHGPNGEGKAAMKTPPMKELAAKSEAELTTSITKGKGKMPAYEGKLTADQIKTLVSEIKAAK